MHSAAHSWSEPDLYILADEDLIETCSGAVRSVCPVEKRPDPVLVPDKPWEGARPDGPADSLQDPFYGTVLWDPAGGYFRCWYNAYDRRQNRVYSPPIADQGYSCCYAVSGDGIDWEKPDLGLVLHEGSYSNNIVRFKDIRTQGSSNLGEQVWNVLPYGAPDSEDGFVASMFTQFDDPVFPTGITMCYSPDGTNWRMRYPPVLGLEGDCHGMSWDPVSGCYLLTTRSHEYANLCRRWGHQWRRHIALFKSRDLEHWTAATTILEVDDEDPADAQLYLMYIIPYGHAYLGQLLMFYGHELVLDNQLALSRDLLNWQRVGGRRPILLRGSDGDWDSKHVALTHNPPVPEGNLMRFWYGGKDRPHYQAGFGAMGTGTLRRDGFVCVDAAGGDAVVTTIPFRPPRPNAATWVAVNADASDGELTVEITDTDGNAIDGVTREDCFPVRGDHIREIVNFKAGPGSYHYRGNFLRFDQNIRLRFYLRNARLFAFKLPNYEPIWPAA